MNRTFKFTLLALAIAPLCATAAQAETIYLKCGEGSDITTIVVDLDKHTVNDRPAEITPISIDWHNINDIADVHMHIDRTTGSLGMTAIFPQQNNRRYTAPDKQCSAVSAPATKF